MTVTLTLAELGAVVAVAVLLAVLDGASISTLLVAALARKVGLRPSFVEDIGAGDGDDSDGGGDA